MSAPSVNDSLPSQPAINVGLTTALVAGLIDLAGYFGLPVGLPTKIAIGLVVTVLAPVVSGLITKYKVWSPASVSALRDDLLDLVQDMQSANPPAVVTNAPLDPVQAAEAHPGALGLDLGAETQPTPTPRPRGRGRHESP